MTAQEVSDLASTLNLHLRLRTYLQQQYADLDDETLADTLEGISDLREILTQVIRSALEDEVLLSALSTRLSDMKARQARLRLRLDKKRKLVQRAMLEANVKALTEGDFSAFLRSASPALEVTSEDKIPLSFWKPQPPVLDRHALLEALKSGAQIDGASLMEGQTQLCVRSR